MKWFWKGKDGGYESTVTGYWLCEIKSLFSIVLLRFDHGSRDAYHEHAFNSVSWVLKGRLTEDLLREGCCVNVYTPTVIPVITRRETFHRVRSDGTTWVLSFRGPWAKTWKEFRIDEGEVTLTNGREIVQ